MRALLSSVCSAAVVGGLLVGVAGPATAGQPVHRPGPISLSKSSVAEDAAPGTLVGRLTSTDPDPAYHHTFTLVRGGGDGDNNLFRVSGDRLQVAGALDHESDPRLSVRVRVTDKVGHTRDKRLTIKVRDVNERPTAVQLSGGSVAENMPSGTTVGTLSTTDPDKGDTFTYRVVSGAFRVSGDQLTTASRFDYETVSAQPVRIRSTDSRGNWIERAFAVTVTDVDDVPPPVDPPVVTPPVVTPVNHAPYHLMPTTASVKENEDAGTLVAQATAIDPDGDPLTYSRVAPLGRCSRPHGIHVAQRRGCGPENPFAVAANGAITTIEPLNYEYDDSYTIVVKATDPGGLSTQESVTISVENVNEAPRNLWLNNDTITEGAAGIEVGTVSAYDPDYDVLTYSVVAPCSRTVPGKKHRSMCRTPYPSFELDGTTLKTASNLTHAATPTIPVTIKATDPGGLSTQETFTITVNAAPNHAPTNLQLDDLTATWTNDLVGKISADDLDNDTLTYSVVKAMEGDDEYTSSFSIVDGNELHANVCALAGKTLVVTLRADDLKPGGTTDEQFTVTVQGPARIVPGGMARRGC